MIKILFLLHLGLFRLICKLLFCVIKSRVFIVGALACSVFWLSSCQWLKGASTPYFTMTNFKVPDGTPAFKSGFKDGCSSVLYSRGNMFYRTRYKYKYDANMTGNSEYRFGHSRGYSWCFQKVLRGPVASFDRYLYDSGYDKTFSAKDINQAWDGMFLDGPMKHGPDSSGQGLNGMMSIWQTGIDGKSSAFGSNPLWAGGAEGQFFGLW